MSKKKSYNRKDVYYEQAKADGYSSRAAFKLMELDKRFRLFKKGDTVLDLGCWPGSWLQVVSEKIGDQGLAIGIDLVPVTQSLHDNVKTIVGNVADPDLTTEIIQILSQNSDREVNAVISDLSPKLTGVREVDNNAVSVCAEAALEIVKKFLKNGGSFVLKQFKSQESSDFAKSINKLFNKVSRCELETTRKSSNEWYLVATGYSKKI